MILCAALKIREDKDPSGFIYIPCWRHGHGYKLYEKDFSKLNIEY